MKKIISLLLALATVCSFAVCAQARSLGDVDKNGQINSSDALLILCCAVGLRKDVDTKLADVDLNGTINSGDALIVLKTAIGAYKEITDIETPVCKSTYLDPIFNSGKYTVKMGSLMYESETIMVNSADAADVFQTKKFTETVLYKNGKTYNVLPEYKKYAEAPQNVNLTDNINSYFTNLTFVGTTMDTVKMNTYRCEVFKNSKGQICKFYFNGTTWEYFIVLDETGKTSLMASQILAYSGNVDSKLFTFDGYEKMSIEALEDFISTIM